MHLIVGQTPYLSKLTNTTEYLPAAIGIVGGKGSDAALVGFIGDFTRSIGKSTVDVGTTAFPTTQAARTSWRLGAVQSILSLTSLSFK